ncbi:hypothetical protein QBC42DRAFT_335369 [Cladorrhinum samala]|uniref:Uncharacterized protein n=1 Tax=Cladorrhinum samala TaxID=585594 RepID=A0AAV9I197_9PEZI|nr:hypothetical protein QBC42DRAFT_335369 [Cladorrhinum samala]
MSNNNPFAQNPLTYTTVGSIYNPHATTIQPPTRRPRTRRYPNALESPGFALGDELLSSLPLKQRVPITPPTTAGTLLQYTPLQQNYDRAVNPTELRTTEYQAAELPMTDLECSVLSNLGMSVPTIRSGNLPPPSGLDDDDSVASEDTLASSRITVKGLTNLASYPNPMQKAAQKALARARPANLSISRPGTPPSLMQTASGRDDLAMAVATYGIAPSAANGPPQPLTAGPPGHRQYNALGVQIAMRQTAAPPSRLFYGGDGSIYDMTSGSLALSQRPQDSVRDGASGWHIVPRSTASKKPDSRPTTPIAQLARSDNNHRKAHDAALPEQLAKYYSKPQDEDWYNERVAAVEQQDDPFLRLNNTVEHRRKQNRAFYAGTEGLVKDMDQVEREFHYRRLENKVGVIGGERRRTRDNHLGRSGQDGKVQPKPLSIWEAIEKPESEHAQPLINMAYSAMLNYKEDRTSAGSVQQGWCPKFVEVDEEWVDCSVEGNKSLFDKPKEPLKKKKLVVKKTRLGY